MKIIKQIWRFILSVFSFGLSAYLLSRKNEKKVESLLVSTNNMLEKSGQVYDLWKEGQINYNTVRHYINPESFKKILETVQERYGVANEIKADIKILLKEKKIVKVYNGSDKT